MQGRNLEFKARLPAGLDAARLNAAWLGATLVGVVRHTDTYFGAAQGQLKLREANPGGAELIAYERPAGRGARGCDSRRLRVLDAATLKALLGSVLGVRAVVCKLRELWLWDNVRIHLDVVDGLGTFLEFEVPVGPERPDATCQKLLATALDRFGLSPMDGLPGSYADMVETYKDL